MMIRCIPLLFVFGFTAFAQSEESSRPRVLVITDVCQGCGNANDVHSLVYLLWHSDEINLVGVHPNDLDSIQGSTGIQALKGIFEAYAQDYEDPLSTLSSGGHPKPEVLNSMVPNTFEESVDRIIRQAKGTEGGPLYILNWSNLRTIRAALERSPDIAANIRLLTVASRTNYDGCREPNLNGWGRDQLFRDARFKRLWWLEMDWTPTALVNGVEAVHLLNVLGRFGMLGGLLLEEAQSAAEGFRGTEAASLIYLLDPTHPAGDPTVAGWAGRYVQPFPEDRPSYYTDDMGDSEWDYEKPCRTWIDRKLALENCQSQLLNRREEVFAGLLAKVNSIYPAEASARTMAVYEAENAQITPDLRVKNDLTASHGFFVEMKGSGRIAWLIEEVPSAGDYILRIRYRLPYLHKTQRILINGDDRGEITFDGPSNVWQEKEVIQPLNEGTNEIVIEKDWGYVDFDSISLTSEAT